VFIKIVEQFVRGIARSTGFVESDDQSVAQILFEQFARREVMLEIDDHGRLR
jgi:hypothetical protein